MKKMMKSLMATIGVALTITGSVFAADVAKIGEKGYATLQAAIDVVQNGETITLLAECAETITFTQTKDVSFVIDGNNQKMTGSINITARAGKDAASTLVIKNFQFVTDKISHDFIKSVETNYYPNNITIENCSFIGTADIASAGYAVVAVRLKSANNILVKDCTGSGLHSFLQNTAGWNVNLDNVDVTDSLGGFAMGTVQGTTIKNCDLDVETMGIRLDAQYDNKAVITDCKVTAFIPVVVCKASVDGTLTFSGSNTMTAENTDGLWCAIGTAEYKENGTMPTAPTGKVVVTLNDTGLNASGVYGNYGVAMVNGVKYITLKDAVAAVADGGVIMLIANETFTEATRTQNSGSWYDGIYYIGDKSFTIDLGGFTISHDGAVNDYLLNFKNDGTKANTITLKNGTIDAGTAAYCAICTSSVNTQKITINTENINIINDNSNGSAVKIRGGAEFNAKAGTKITGKNSYLGIECVASTVNIYDGVEIYMNGTGSYNGCLVGACGGGVVNVYGGYGKGVKGGFIAMTSGGSINVFGGEWIANNDGTVGNNSNFYVLTAQNNKNESGYVGASVINVTGGIFRGGMDAWVLNVTTVEKAELNIAGGNFNANPTAYLDEGYVVNEVSGVYTVAKAVAKIGAGYYTNLVDAFKAATEGCTIDILSDVTIDYKWDCRDYATGGSHSQFKESVTINGNGHTLKFTGTVNDSNWNTIFRFEENATVNNLTVDISEATGAQRVISAKKSLTVDGLTIVGSAKYGIIFGEGASTTDLAAAEIVVKNSTLTGTRRAISDNEGGKDVKSVAITDNTLNANVYASASESITFNNNTAAGEVDLRSYTAENVLRVEAKGNTLNAGVKNYIYAKNIDAQEGFTAERVPTTVSTYEQLIAALAEDNAYVVLANDITATATQSSGYGKAGIVVEAGDVLDGNDKTLTINGANATWDCAIAMRGGEVKNLTIAGAMRGVFMPGANGDVVIDNCKFQDVIYTFNSDAGSKDYTVTIKNTELNGWTSFSDVHKAVVFDTCTFAKGNGYAYCRPYQATTFKDCSFSDDFAFDCSRVADNTLAFNECTYNGQAITSENAFDLFGDGAKVLVNGAPADYTRVAKVGDNYYTSINAALAAAQDGATVELLWAEGNAPIAMNGSVFGKSVKITGTATVDWSKGWLFVGRGGEGDGTVIFDNAKLTSSEASLKNGSYGIHVSAPEKGSTSKCNGTVIIQNNSDIQLSYLANRHNVTVDNSRLYVEYGFWVGGRPANETPDSQPGIANMELVNNSTVTVKNHNGMGVGYESVGNLAIEAGSTFEYLNDAGLRVKANSSLVSAGNFFGKIAAESDAHIEISGGVYTQDVNEWCVEGCAALPDLNGKYVVGVKPTATVNNLGMVTVPAGDYMVYGGGSNGNDMPLSFVMQFLADQTEADMATSPYADWYGDFVITFTGIKDDSFTADGCYLAGHYGDFGWVKVPVDGMTIENGVRYPVMLGVGMGQKYEYICSGVKDFMCAMYLTPEILSANPNLQVKLELAVVDNANGEDAATSALVNNEKVFSVVDYEYTVDDFTILEKTYEVGAGKAFATMNEAIAQAKADGADVVTYTVYGAVTLETGYAHGTVDFGVTDGVTVVGGDADAKMTITGGGVPDIKGVAFKDITLDDAGEYLPTANEFMYQNYVDCTFENVTFLEGPRVSGVSTMTGCTIHQSKSDQYALWLDEGEFTMTGSTVAVSGEGYGMVKSDAVGKITLTDNTFTYQNAANKEALNVKGASIAATGNTFIDCTEGILPADKINYGQDGSTVIDDDAMIAGGNTVKNSVATVGGNKYLTLAGAVEAAQPGDTVTLIADVSEDVTIKKSLTIDGAKSDTEQFKYTGTMSINTSLDVAIQNVNFDKGSISEAKGTRGTLTIKNCTFDGVDKSIGYAITVRGADKLVIENTAAKNYDYGMLYIPSSVAAIAVKDVTVSDVTSAFNIAYSGDGVFENVSVKNATYGLNAHNYGARTFVMKNWTLENVGMMTRVQEKATATVTFDMQGLYDISKLSASQYAKHIADATTGNVIGTLQPVIAAAADGGTVTLSRDIITITEDDCVPGTDHKVLVDVVGKDITLDMNGKTIFVDHKERDTDYIVAAIRVADGAGLTVTGNGTVDVAAHDENPCIYYMFWKRGASGHLTVENGTYHMNNAEDSMVYANAGETVTVNGGTWTLDTYGTRNNRHPWIFNVSGQDDNYITVNGGTFNADINDQYYWYEVRVSLDKALRDNGDGTWTVVNAVAYVENQYWDGKKGKPIGYATLADAVADVDPGKTITLLKNIELSSYLPIEKSLALDLGEFTITRNGGSGVLYVNGSEAEVTINGTTGGITGPQTVWANAGTVTINGGTFNGVGGEAVYATGTGKVVINGGTFSSNIEGFVVNQHDSARDTSSIVINGGTFVGFDPRNNAAETAGTTFMGAGKYTFAEGGNYIVVTPEDYILNDVSSDSATVNEIDSLLAGAVTVIKDGEKYVATATYTFKVTAVDTVNPEKSEYELTGGTLRPGKSVKVKYIDLVTGTESWDKPEADTVTFKLVIK